MSIVKLLNIMIWTSLPVLMSITCPNPIGTAEHVQDETGGWKQWTEGDKKACLILKC